MKLENKTIELNVPNIGDADSIELMRWCKNQGDTFKKGDEICELMSDKAAFSLEAPQDGKLVEIIVSEKKIVKVGQLLAKAEVSTIK